MWPAVIAVSAALMAGLITSRRFKEPEQPLPRLGNVPAFILYDQTGQPFPSSKLEGSVWLADFFFTRCQGLCPLLTERMRELQETLPQSSPWHLVSVTVDPAHDPPGALEEYAREQGARAERWTFLTGEEGPIRALIVQGFRLAVDSDSTRTAEPIVHSQSIVLVDQEGEIRGYYDALDAKAMKTLFRDTKRLLDA